jgi:MFS transporter, YNFM family, putative membrane transport protein
VTVVAAATVITAYAIASAASQYFLGPCGDRYGKLRVLTLILACSAVTSFGCAWSNDLQTLIVWRFATALFASGSMTLGVAYIGDTIDIADRQPVLARFIAGTIIGQALGPLVGGVFTDLAGWRAPFIVLGVVLSAIAAITFFMTKNEWQRAPVTPKSVGGSVFSPALHLRLLRKPRVRRVVLTVAIEAMLFFGVFSFTGAMLKARFDLSYSLIGVTLACFGVGGVAYSLLARGLLRRYGQAGCAMRGGILVAVSYAVMSFTPVWWLAPICAAGLGAGLYLLHNTLQTKASEMAPEARATGVALFSMGWSGGQAIGVALAGFAIAQFGYAWVLCGFGILFAIFALILRSRLQHL